MNKTFVITVTIVALVLAVGVATATYTVNMQGQGSGYMHNNNEEHNDMTVEECEEVMEQMHGSGGFGSMMGMGNHNTGMMHNGDVNSQTCPGH